MSKDTFKAVYAGLRTGADCPLVAVWYKLDADGVPTEEKLCFARKGKRTKLIDSWIGDIYLIEDEDGGCKVIGSRLGQLEDADQRREWKLEEQTAEASVELDRRAAKDDYGEMTLDQLKLLYGKTIGRSRRAVLLALVAQYITQGR